MLDMDDDSVGGGFGSEGFILYKPDVNDPSLANAS